MAVSQKKILKLEDGKLPSPITNNPQVLLVNELIQTVHNLEILVDSVYPCIKNLTKRNLNWHYSREIVSPRNDLVNKINKIIMEKVLGDFKCHKSMNTVCTIKDTVRHSQGF